MGFLFQVKAISIIGDFTLVLDKTIQIQSKTQLSYSEFISALEIYTTTYMLTEFLFRLNLWARNLMYFYASSRLSNLGLCSCMLKKKEKPFAWIGTRIVRVGVYYRP